MSIVINPALSIAAPQGATPDVVLQPGTVIEAKVVAMLAADQVRIAIGGQAIDVGTQLPLLPGQTLQLAVSQTPDGIRLALVDQQAPAPVVQNPTNLSAAALSLDTVTLAPEAIIAAAQPKQVAPAPINALTPQQAGAVSVAAQNAATQQTSLAPLFTNLEAAAALPGLPPKLQQIVGQLLAQRPALDANLTGADIERAFQTSGLFLEASLATGSLPSSASPPDLKAALIVLRQVLGTALSGAAPAASVQLPTGPAAALQSQLSDALAQGVLASAPNATLPPPSQGRVNSASALLTPEQSVTTAATPELAKASPSAEVALTPSVATASKAFRPEAAPELQNAAPAPAGTAQVETPAATPAAVRAAVASATLSLLQEAVQANPQLAGALPNGVLTNGALLSLLPGAAGARLVLIDEGALARTNVPPPPISGALPSAQPIAPVSLQPNAPLESTLRHLLTDTDGAIARQTLLQVASLPDRGDAAPLQTALSQPRWSFEIPFATPQGTAVAQFEISRDRDQSTENATGGQRVWRARFSLDVEPAGPVHALVALAGDKTSVRMWAERPATAAQLRAGVSQLSQALSRADLQPGDIVVRDGAPTQNPPAPAGHFLDRAL